LRSFLGIGAGWTTAGGRGGASWTTAGGRAAAISASFFASWLHHACIEAQPPKVIAMTTTNNAIPNDLFLIVHSFIRFVLLVTHSHRLPTLRNDRFNNFSTGQTSPFLKLFLKTIQLITTMALEPFFLYFWNAFFMELISSPCLSGLTK